MTPCYNHQQCVDSALATAQKVCQQQGVRLTATRQKVLLLLWQSHRPIGAYALMEMLSQDTRRRVAPPTIYRALEFLLDLGLIHRINSLNAYVGCSSPQDHKDGQDKTNFFFICDQCHYTQEIIHSNLTKDIKGAGEQMGFEIHQQWLEVTGLCRECQDHGY